MRFIRYVNGKMIETDLRKCMIESEIILKAIKAVNERLKNDFHQDLLAEKGS